MCIFASFLLVCGSLVFGWNKVRFALFLLTSNRDNCRFTEGICNACIMCWTMTLMKPEYCYEKKIKLCI